MPYLLRKILKYAVILLTLSSLTNCPNPVGLSSFDSGKKGSSDTGGSSNSGNAGQSPWNKDFEITGLYHYYNYDKKERAAAVVPKPGTKADVTDVYYKGVDGTVYDVTTKAPKEAGNYVVTFDITDEDGNKVKGLYAGILTIDKLDMWLSKQEDFGIAGKIHKVEWYDETGLADVKDALLANPKKHVSLDLSGTAFSGGIGVSAFEGCENLTFVTMPYGVKNIGNFAFIDCIGLVGINIPGSVTSIGDYAFSGCDSLTGIIIPDSVTEINNYAFSGCQSLTNIIIPDSVESIGAGAFRSCLNLKNIEISKNIKNVSISEQLFYGCSKLTGITIPANIIIIEDNAFSNCVGLTSATIPVNVKNIGSGIHNNCFNLVSVTFEGTINEDDYNTVQSNADGGGMLYLRNAFYGQGDAINGTPGTYTRVIGGTTWTWAP